MINIVLNDAEVANMLAGGAEGAKRNDIYYYVNMVNSENISTVSSTYILMGRCNHSLSLDATIMVSKYCPIIGEYVVIIFVTQQVTIATV